MRREKEQKFTYYGLGFPIHLVNFPMKKYWGEEMADINYNVLKRVAIELLAKKPIPLTGYEVRFIRQYFRMNYTQFAHHLGQTRQAVAKWELKGDSFASILPSTELHIRLSILKFLDTNSDKFRSVYDELDSNDELKKKKHKMQNRPLCIHPSDMKNISIA